MEEPQVGLPADHERGEIDELVFSESAVSDSCITYIVM
jgi:hypothetical protein